ncbi:hypothetical protein EDB84DRAFT_1530800 [Lactarius hengduanensis]|nr:hypothetical protein EDB84DRAFT_1551758 [Lactarius hengduanensis]KAH9014007.1 hypothetical protein EDB84DRAFT_1530800 [Lactarius hengduanensis]
MLRHAVQPDVRAILETLPKTLDETYERVLKDINKNNRDHARRLLHCLAISVRPLRVEELAEILTFDFDTARGGIPKSTRTGGVRTKRRLCCPYVRVSSPSSTPGDLGWCNSLTCPSKSS